MTKTIKKEILQDFDERWVKAPSFHDPYTHQNYPAEYSERLADSGAFIKMKELKDFLSQAIDRAQLELLEEITDHLQVNGLDWDYLNSKILSIKKQLK